MIYCLLKSATRQREVAQKFKDIKKIRFACSVRTYDKNPFG